YAVKGRRLSGKYKAMTTFTDFHRSDFNVAGEDLAIPPIHLDGDILWRDQAGDNVVWVMNNNTLSGGFALPFVTAAWHFKAAAEFDAPGIGTSDILWQNDNGALVLWQVNEAQVTAINALPNPGPTWHVVGDNDFNGDFGDDIFFQNDNG